MASFMLLLFQIRGHYPSMGLSPVQLLRRVVLVHGHLPALRDVVPAGEWVGSNPDSWRAGGFRIEAQQ